ncbi:MAG TPA: hypothetical protein VLE22_10630, partial [Bryobacteraceae bacterium]|nr:hypothetical protein [Bryobacteraceae bacterium]
MKMKAPRSIGVSGRDLLLRKATALFNEQCAIAILANLPQRINSEDRRAHVAALATQPTKQLREFAEMLRRNVEKMRDDLGIKLDQGKLLALMDDLQNSAPSDYACYIPVWRLSEWLSRYDSLGLDPHWRVSIDPHCIGKKYPGGWEIRALEATMFEDMAALFNMARHAHLE